MNLGDKILVTYANDDQFVGRIYGETEKSWKVEFDSNDKRTIRKTMDIKIIDDPVTDVDETPVVEPVEVEPASKLKKIDKPEESFHGVEFKTNKRVRRNNVIILGGILLAMVAIGTIIIIGIF